MKHQSQGWEDTQTLIQLVVPTIIQAVNLGPTHVTLSVIKAQYCDNCQSQTVDLRSDLDKQGAWRNTADGFGWMKPGPGFTGMAS